MRYRPFALMNLLDGPNQYRNYSRNGRSAPIADQVAQLRRAVFGARVRSYSASATLAKLLFDHYGPVPAVVEEVAAIRSAAPLLIEHFWMRIRGTQASLLGENTDWSQAVAITAKMIRQDRLTALNIVSISVVEQLYRFGVETSKLAESCATALARTREDESGFEALMRDRSVRIAVVGNSPIEAGRGRGAEIDRHDLVIRFNNYSDDPAYAADYGRRTDVWVRAGSHAGVWRRQPQTYRWIVFSGPDRRHHGVRAWDVIDVVAGGGHAAFVPTRIATDLSRSLGYAPSAGLLILYWLKCLRGTLTDGSVSLYGFSLDDQPAGEARLYFDRPDEGIADKHVSRHNWTAEARMLHNVVMAG